MAKKKTAKRAAAKPRKTEIVVRVQAQTLPAVPTVTDLSEPMSDGKKLTIPSTWLKDTQILKMVQRTPKEHVYKRKGRGGKEFDYVTGAYIEKVLNYVFGWNWDFEILEHGVAGDYIWVKGRLTVRGTKEGQQIVKTQFGRAEIKYVSKAAHKPENYIDFGNDLKAASTDALKKCASLLGIASDIYGKSEYKEETNREPREAQVAPNPVTHPEKFETPQDTRVVHTCVGLDGRGCKYGTEEISEQVANYSKRVYGKELCPDCQKDAKPKK